MCGAINEEQSKSGPNVLQDYKMEEDIPLWLMEDLNGAETTCYECGKKLKLIFDIEVKLKKKAVEPIDNLDWIELEYRKRQEKKKKIQAKRKYKGL
jgi:hypothetical protein